MRGLPPVRSMIAIFGLLGGTGFVLSGIDGSGPFPPAVPPEPGSFVSIESFVGEAVEFELVIANQSDESLRVLGARQTDMCGIDGCRELSGFPFVVAPQSSGFVKGRYLARRPGTIQQEVVLITDDPKRREFPLQLVIHATTPEVRPHAANDADE